MSIGRLVARPVHIIPAPKRPPPTMRTHLGPNLSFTYPPEIIVMGPTEFATVNTMASIAAVYNVPWMPVSFSARGEANTLHA